MIFAKIDNNLVTDIFMSTSTAILPPGEYVEAHANVYVGCPYVDGAFVGVTPPPPPEPEPEPTPEEYLAWAKTAKAAAVDAQTSAAITAGFTYEVEGTAYHFSYDSFDQQNFADTAMVATLVLGGQSAPGMPQNVTWNAYTLPDKTLARLTFTPAAFLGLYTGGALAHKATQMELGGQRKAAVEAATSIEEVNTA